MRAHISPLFLLLLPQNLIFSSFAFAPNPILVSNELEHLLVDTGGANDGGFKRAITPCTNYVEGSQLLGRETAAQWIRVAFHDFVTADVGTGVGGLDASIGFETLRAENSGTAMNDSLTFFAPFVSAQVSMADMIALSVVMSVGGCGGPHIPLRGGRIDATQAGVFGVPEPETDLEQTLEEFSGAGFNQSDAIALTACGHTMGNVHHGGFPQVVPESAVTPNNTGGGVHFDVTPANFDIDVVQEYLSGTGQRGGPLVTTDNVTVRSDLRLYTSDNNQTLQALSQSSNYFRKACAQLFSRMIDTVPKDVKLTTIIEPMVYKPVNVSLGLTSDSNSSLSIYLDTSSSSNDPAPTLFISYETRLGSPASHRVIATYTPDVENNGTSIFGNTYYYRFTASIDSSAGISAYTVANTSFALRDTIFFLPDLSSAQDNGSDTWSVNITAAALTSSNPSNVRAVLFTPTGQLGTLAPRIVTQNVTLNEIGSVGVYKIYSAVVVVETINIGGASVDIVGSFAGGREVIDEFKKLSLII
ncbi:heme peroxidase 8 [Heterobasidion irregulare TC 32-1]|uniref:Peroxidase n=1 Tax=Heterobasidion irregulare (strain TC 32-1) TaxID=747525 RepID=W4K8B2_HETIT|nr:heme peroxidase 8 [Heterobasidion irregulare TC 32-1]ETW81281.1 heme peroxidase 8 [Heterobasidion irregulare TC 32-1]